MTETNHGRSHPWVKFIRDESELRGSVRQHGEDHLRFWLRELGARDAATHLEFLDTNAPHQALQRVRGMLETLRAWIIPRGEEETRGFAKQRLAELHVPINIRADSARLVTSPVMLATTAVVYSQSDWIRRRFHDVRSALRTEEHLATQGYCPEIIELVALLVGLKNIARTAVGEDKEVGVWIDDGLTFDDDEIARCFAAVLRGLQLGGKVMEKAFADALLLVSVGYEGRNKTPERELLKSFEGHTESIKEKLEALDSDGFDREPGTLVALEFGKYVFRDSARRKEHAEVIARYLVDESKSSRPCIIWISFDRYWSSMHGDKLAGIEKEDLPLHLDEWGKREREKRPKCFTGALGPKSTHLYRIKFEGNSAFKVITGQEAEDDADIWKRIAILLKHFREHRKGDRRIPTAYLARQLQILYYCYPDDMFQLRVEGDEHTHGLSYYTSLWLPKDAPTTEELEGLIENHSYSSSKLLVARYAAAMVMNRSIAYGYPARALQSVEAETPVEKWSKLIEWAAIKNAHVEWSKYLRKFRAAPPDELYYVPQRILAEAVPDPLVLGVDIGGMYTKIRLYRYLYAPEIRKHLVKPYREPVQFETRHPDGRQYKDATEFVQRLKRKLRERCPQEWTEDRKHIVAIGVAWPGAVAGRPGLEYVAANSTALTYFKPFPAKNHWEADAASIRGFRLREAFETHFKNDDGQYPHVRLINDAVAHVIFERWQLEGFKRYRDELVVGLTAGTGSGMAVLDADRERPVDVLAEVGRLITHISDPFPPPGAPPAGTGRDAFNRKTLGAVALKLLKEQLSGEETAKAFLKRRIVEGTAAQVLALALGDSVPAGTPGLLPEVPSLLIGWLIEEKHSADPTETKEKLDRMWQDERPPGETDSLDDVQRKLHAFLQRLAHPDWRDEKGFASEVVDRAGRELADLIATTTSIFGATNVITGGGPLSGCVGEELRESARYALEKDYKFTVLREATDSAVRSHRLARLIRLPEPHRAGDSTAKPEGPSGPYGAVAAAMELLGQ